MNESGALKDLELRIVSELMKNCHRTDRELARAIGVSQPTVSRTIRKLEEEGYVKEYAMIPDFRKLGFNMFAFTFVKLTKQFPEEAIEEMRKRTRERISTEHVSDLLTMRGTGLGTDVILVSVHEDYLAYSRFLNVVRDFNENVGVDETRSFLVSLNDNHFRPLTFSELANYVQESGTQKEKRKNHASLNKKIS